MTTQTAQIYNMELFSSSKSPEWYTPATMVEKVIELLGEIDLDPCSNPHPYQIPAKVHYTQEDDGLSKERHGRVYMNPPYGREISKWTTKLESEYQSGNVTEAIALTPARVDTKWFRGINKHPLCFIHGRLKFEIGGSTTNPAPFSSMATYFGTHPDRFKQVFQGIGSMYAPY